jgi:hypothetical protein
MDHIPNKRAVDLKHGVLGLKHGRIVSYPADLRVSQLATQQDNLKRDEARRDSQHCKTSDAMH